MNKPENYRANQTENLEFQDNFDRFFKYQSVDTINLKQQDDENMSDAYSAAASHLYHTSPRAPRLR